MKAKDVKTAKCHHGYSKKSCKECRGEKKIIKEEQKKENVQATIVVAAMYWYDSVRFENPSSLSDQENHLRESCSKLEDIYNATLKIKRKKKT